MGPLVEWGLTVEFEEPGKETCPNATFSTWSDLGLNSDCRGAKPVNVYMRPLMVVGFQLNNWQNLESRHRNYEILLVFKYSKQHSIKHVPWRGGMDPCILKLGTGRWLAFNFTPKSLCLQRCDVRDWIGFECGRRGKQKNIRAAGENLTRIYRSNNPQTNTNTDWAIPAPPSKLQG
jgi:hypothetical protein